MQVPLSLLDLVPIPRGGTASEALATSVELARTAERCGYKRVWYAEHHNRATIGSAATSVVIAHMAACTERIRVGAGGVMLPNHSPLTIAEQFGTLEALHPGRVDLGLGRAPGSDRRTIFALRRSDVHAERFPDDVLELQAYLTGRSRVPGVQAVPGAGSNLPLYILGSSLYGAQLAANLGLPYAFASHFAPAALTEAVALYRARFSPSDQLGEPYVIAGVNVVAAGSEDEAVALFAQAKRNRVAAMFGRDHPLSDEEVEAVLASPAGRHVEEMLAYSAVGTPGQVNRYLEELAGHIGADELMTVHLAPGAKPRLASVELLARGAQPQHLPPGPLPGQVQVSAGAAPPGAH